MSGKHLIGAPGATLACPCEPQLSRRFLYEAPPEGETRFDLRGAAYRREYWTCDVCGHFFSAHDIDLAGLYGADYVNSTYGERMRQVFERILALPPESSDNTGRVARILSHAEASLAAAPGRTPRTLLDIGSGLAVFPFRMAQHGWRCTALDPDPRAAEHARTVAGLAAVTGDFMTIDPASLGRFDAVTFNKVLEHVLAPVEMLRRALPCLAPGGFVYVEVPDGEAAGRDGPHREEFFIEHHHVFTAASLAMTAGRAGFAVATMERLREPSSKYTLRAFLVPAVPDGAGAA